MKRNNIILMVALIIVLLGMFLFFLSAYYPSDNGAGLTVENVTLNVSSEGPMELSEIIPVIGSTEHISEGGKIP